MSLTHHLGDDDNKCVLAGELLGNTSHGRRHEPLVQVQVLDTSKLEPALKNFTGNNCADRNGTVWSILI